MAALQELNSAEEAEENLHEASLVQSKRINMNCDALWKIYSSIESSQGQHCNSLNCIRTAMIISSIHAIGIKY